MYSWSRLGPAWLGLRASLSTPNREKNMSAGDSDARDMVCTALRRVKTSGKLNLGRDMIHIISKRI